MIYLDNNASTPVDPEVAAEMLSAIRSNYGNPSSGHEIGMRAKASVEKARSQVAALLGVSPEDIIFTSGGTESNNLAIIGLAHEKGKGHIITSVIEHPSVINPCRHLEGSGFSVTYVGVEGDGKVRVDEVKKAIRGDTFLITIMHANNETGVLQPIEEIGAIAREKGIVFHTDAAQTIGKIPVRANDLGMMTIVSHKFYGPKGIGSLLVRKEVTLHPILFGAGHERGLRPGTENVPGIVGFGKACELSQRYLKERITRTQNITDSLFGGLREKIKGLRLNGHETDRLPNTLNIAIPGIDAIDLIEAVKDAVAVSSGSACHSGRREASPVLKAMGISDEDAMASLRLSTGKDNTEEEMREAEKIIAKVVLSIRSG